MMVTKCIGVKLMVIHQKAYAKINLILNVLAKRDDNYHQVDFVMTTINLFDLISVNKSVQDQVVTPNLEIKMTDNLAYQAWQLLKKEYNLAGCVTITIDKQIPIAAGMAGGSSDAAAVLRAINELYNLKLSLIDLAFYGKQLGSDVAFCVHSQLARATNKGEQITLLNQHLPPLHVVAINPGIALKTNKVYQKHLVTSQHQKIEKFYQAQTFEEIVSCLSNDLAKTAKQLVPEINEMIDYLNAKYHYKTLVSGSGPTVLVFCPTYNQAQDVFKYAKIKYNYVFQTKVRS